MLKTIRAYVIPVLSYVIAALFLACATPVILWALQEAGSTLPTPIDQNQALAIAIYSAVIPFAVELAKKFMPQLPRLAVLALPYVLGGVLTLLGKYTGLHGWEGFLASLGAHALYELKSTAFEHKLG